MFGQGSPQTGMSLTTCWKPVVMALLFFLTSQPLNADDSEKGMRLRFSFGGPEPSVWKGKIELPLHLTPTKLRILGIKSDHVGRIYTRRNQIIVDLTQPTIYGGLEFEVVGNGSDQLEYKFECRSNGREPRSVNGSVQLEELVDEPHAQQLADTEDRIYLERAPGDEIKFLTPRTSLVLGAGERLNFAVALSRFSSVDLDTEKQLVAKVKRTHGSKEILWAAQATIGKAGVPIEFETDSPFSAGVYDLRIEITEPSTIPFSSPVVIRKRDVQFIVADNQPVKPIYDSADNVELVFENDGGTVERFSRGRFKSWDKLNLSARKLFRNLQLPGLRTGKRLHEIGNQSLKLFPLSVGKEQELYKLEIEYESPEKITFDLVVFDRTGLNQNYSELTSRSFRHAYSAVENRTRKQSLLFWSKSQQPVLMVRNLDSTDPIKVSRIRVYRFADKSEEFKLFTNQNRRLFTQFSGGQLTRLLAAPKSTSDGQYPLDDWRTFQLGGKRLIRLVKTSKYQGVVLDVNGAASGLYPSRYLKFSPAMDTGSFSTSGRDPIRKDVLELLFKQFTVNGLTLIPRIEIPKSIATFESAETSFQKDIRLQRVDDSYSSAYNHLNPHVQDFLEDIVLEVVRRYSKHPSFGGVCLKIGANDQLVIRNRHGYNDALVGEFLKQKEIQFASAQKPSQKKNLVYDKHASEFKKWQTAQATRFFAELNQKVNQECQKNLVLDFSDVYTGLSGEALAPSLRLPNPTPQILVENGLNVEAMAKEGIGLLATNMTHSSWNLASRRLEFALQNVSLNNSKTLPVHNSVRNVFERIEAANNAVHSTPFENVIYHASVPNSNFEFRKKLVECIAKHDVLLFIDDFELGNRAIDDSSRRIWTTYASLPNVTFDSVTNVAPESPVIVRTKTVGNESFLYVLNQSPWPTQVTIKFNSPIVNFRNVNGTFFSSLEKEKSGGTLKLSLKPYDLVAGRSDQKELKVSGVQFSFPESLKNDLTRTKDRLLAKIRFLKTPESIAASCNPSFERFDNARLPSKWSWSNSKSFKVETQSENASEGKQLLLVSNESASDWGWIRSQFLPNRGTGRISLLISMKANESGKTPQIRLSVDGQSKGQEYYRFGSFSSDPKTPASARIENKWKVFAVHFNDVPPDIERLRVGLDVSGQGKILIDDVKVFDRWFDAQDKEALSKIVSLAAHNISTGEYLKAYHLMNSYWPRFIQQYESQSASEKQ